jgi:hypothetical protein
VQELPDSRPIWLAAGIVLVVLQCFFTAVQLCRSHMGMSAASLPRLSSITESASSTTATILLLFPPFMDAVATWRLLRLCFHHVSWPSASPFRDAVDGTPAVLDSALSHWMRDYTRRRLAIAAVLQATPQAFFHVYLLTTCYPTPSFSLQHTPSYHALIVASIMNYPVLALAVGTGAVLELQAAVFDWLSRRTWGFQLQQPLPAAGLVTCFLYVADTSSDIVFTVVSHLDWSVRALRCCFHATTDEHCHSQVACWLNANFVKCFHCHVHMLLRLYNVHSLATSNERNA